MTDRLKRLAELHSAAILRAPALRRRFDEAGLSPASLAEPGQLESLPVLKKETLLDMQAADPPFAGFLNCDPSEIQHVFVSPGPICEPLLRSDATGLGMDRMFASAGIGPGDVALNTWAYHLVPAGLLFDRGLQSVGATVIPSGTGQTELQCTLIRTLRPTAFLGSTAYFQTIADTYFATGEDRGWSFRHAFLGGEFGDWSAKRRSIEARYGLKTWSCYATADLGLVGYEKADTSCYHVHEDRLVQICDPATGRPLGTGETGEIVVTTLSRGWPMIRFATGDLARALAFSEDGFASKLSFLEGRVGEAVKVREIFVYPRHIRALAEKVAGLAEARAVVTREDGRDTITLEFVAADGLEEGRVHEQFRAETRLKLDRAVRVGEFTISKTLEDRKQ